VYTKYFTSIEGFNPSNVVVTHVVPLYYYRDAHRVVQIINHRARSYNAATVDVRRRAADRARDEADLSKLERQTKERDAIRRATETRRKEAELRKATEDNSKARSEIGSTTLSITQLQIQVNDLKAQTDQATANASALAATKPSNDPAVIEARILEKQAKDAFQAQNRQLTLAQQAQSNAQQTLTETDRRISTLNNEIQSLRSEEIAANEQAIQAEGREDLKRGEQFRREVAAAREDPNTVANGDPESIDPVGQTTLTVVGEALIQLRGPLKGVNMCRLMIHQLDSPVGQVRLAVHTLQVNGERGDRMEEVADKIRTSIDQARFMTSQSAELLRRAVVIVATRKAQEACPPGSVANQNDRDRKYLHSFFGKDFIDELMAMDSEFLHTGNKLLSLHSMDSTSLASAQFLMALARNTVRMEIIEEFRRLIDGVLPLAEQEFLAQNVACTDAKCKHGDKCRSKCQPIFVLSPNSRFASLMGYFASDGAAVDDTMTPVQREFLKLAQILKARLITELEFKQRVFERAQLEDRIGNYLEELKAAKNKEDLARRKAEELRVTLGEERASVFAPLTSVAGLFQGTISRMASTLSEINPEWLNRLRRRDVDVNYEDQSKRVKDLVWRGDSAEQQILNKHLIDQIQRAIIEGRLTPEAANRSILLTQQLILDLGRFKYTKYLNLYLGARRWVNAEENRSFPSFSSSSPVEALEKVAQKYSELLMVLRTLAEIVEGVQDDYELISRAANPLLVGLTRADVPVFKLYSTWLGLREQLRVVIRTKLFDVAFQEQINSQIQTADRAFQNILLRAFQVELAEQNIRLVRRPLDVKKMLDMLVDEVEDKYIDFLESTRSHIANIDNYVKRIATALDDDFNRQYYEPSFRNARNASRYWDVTLGNIETTSVLTNNRGFGKVSPSATFEFDLPKRDTLIKEGFSSAKAMVDEYGALVTDPSFLSLAKMMSGQPVSSLAQGTRPTDLGGGASMSSVRSMLPGLPTSSDETVMAQAGPGRREFGSALEALIPDPAIYKFETGTGFEIRPVISPDGQAVVYRFNYMYTFDIREPVRADEKHLGRVKRHFIDTDVQNSNYELREVSRYIVALKVARTSRGPSLLQDLPGVGVLFRPLPSAQSSFQENLVYTHAVIFPTLFELMGLRFAPSVANLDPLKLINDEFVVRYRKDYLSNTVFDISSGGVDDALRVHDEYRRADLYRGQHTIPSQHPNGYVGPGLGIRDSHLREGYNPNLAYPETPYAPNRWRDGNPQLPDRTQTPMAPPYLRGQDDVSNVAPAVPDQGVGTPQLPTPQVKSTRLNAPRELDPNSKLPESQNSPRIPTAFSTSSPMSSGGSPAVSKFGGADPRMTSKYDPRMVPGVQASPRPRGQTAVFGPSSGGYMPPAGVGSAVGGGYSTLAPNPVPRNTTGYAPPLPRASVPATGASITGLPAASQSNYGAATSSPFGNTPTAPPQSR